MLSMPALRRVALLCALLCLAACGGGTKLVKHPAQDASTLLSAPAAVQAEDGRLRAALHAVVLPNGPGSWAQNAYWDEYYVQVTNVSAQPVQLTGLAVVDSTGTRLAALDDRKALVRGSKATAKRYRAQGVKVTGGAGSAGLMLAGAGVTVAGVGTAVGATYASVLAGGGTAAGATAAAGAMMLAGPAIAIVGIVRAVRIGQVTDELHRRAPAWPIVIAPGETRALDAFVPLAPSPTRVELDYAVADATQQLVLDVQAPLQGLHVPARPGITAAK
jgi:hypothetical protein